MLKTPKLMTAKNKHQCQDKTNDDFQKSKLNAKINETLRDKKTNMNAENKENNDY